MSPYQNGDLTTGQVARMFGVRPETVTRWANSGKLSTTRNRYGHRRYDRTQVQQLAQPRRDADGPQ